ncbi:MAG TPA: L-2-hydroxyglutarate oxidase [Solirubrobacteraceae bacterium]|jgi:L-2-hydroxyglutarate oxidase|nr:L-2-hydroxyglutarate oxidase [Solirubrobacteraceae bacterium]
MSAAQPTDDVPRTCDVAIVGGGIVGLGVARELLARRPQASICVLERESDVAAHQTSHNSGVIHAGVYYVPGSLKARLCVEGAREMYEYCEANGIANERCGKLIVATSPDELERLDEIQRRAQANAVPGVRRIDAAEIERLEPHARGIDGLYSPNTGIVDFAEVARCYARDVREAGGIVATSAGVERVAVTGRSLRITHARGVTEAGNAIFCAGAWADRLAVGAGADPDPRIVPFRGAYLQLVPERRHLVRSLIYPVPDPSLPFLGVHLTKHIDGSVLIGPTALMVGARDAYSLSRVRAKDAYDTLAWPGTWKMLQRFWATGVTEIRHAAQRAAFVRAAARFLPELAPADVEPSFAGVRAQALARDGRLVDDFVFSRTERALHVRNAPSPAATSSLAIARHVADQATQAFALA